MSSFSRKFGILACRCMFGYDFGVYSAPPFFPSLVRFPSVETNTIGCIAMSPNRIHAITLLIIILSFSYKPQINMAEQDHPRRALHNYAVRQGLSLTYGEHRAGPDHNPTWTAVVYINGTEYARASDGSLGAAKDQAARRTIQFLASQSS